MSRLVAILGGGDWADALIYHLVIPDDMDLDEQKAAHGKWYHEEFVPKLGTLERSPFINLREWLIIHGAREATENDVIEYFEE